jgi:hypothetical protein
MINTTVEIEQTLSSSSSQRHSDDQGTTYSRDHPAKTGIEQTTQYFQTDSYRI